MIIEYVPDTGRIFHVIGDPVHSEMEDFLKGAGKTFASFPPVPWPQEHERDPDTGEFLFDGNGDPLMSSNGMDFQECNIATDYFHEGEIKRRPDCGCSVSVDGSTVSIADLPEGSTVKVYLDPGDPADTGIDVPVVDGAASVTVDEAGPLRLYIRPPWPYLDENHVLETQ